MDIGTELPPQRQQQQQLASLAQIFAQRALAALPTEYALSLSMHDATGLTHWQSTRDGADLGDAPAAAINAFRGKVSMARTTVPMSGGRTALALRSANRMGEFLGFVIIVTDSRRLNGKVAPGRDLPEAVLRAAREWGYAMAAKLGSAAIATDPAPPAALTAKAPAVEDAEYTRQRAELQAMPIALHAQRLVPLQNSARTRRYEVLIRPEWDHNADDSTQALLLRLEVQKLGAQLDRRVLHDLVAWLQPRLSIWHLAPAQFTLNLANTTVHDAGFIECVEYELKKAQLPTGLVAFEVDQALCRREPKRVESLANLLQRLGSALVVDNFTLHDDSVRLLMLPGISMVKIDREMTGEALVSRAGQARLAGLTQMCKVSGVHSVAKKVDGENEHALLAALGIDFAQGFAIAEPTPISAIDSERRMQLVDPPAIESTDELRRPTSSSG
jgi:EAL domain-containing protein (putative c-di-GMP-specific phosphodiesterase class I)